MGSLLFFLVFLGLLAYLLQLLPLEGTIKHVINVVLIVFCILVVIDFFFGMGMVPRRPW